ncbi:unnamed protein product [Caenorhabditis auriculariae]|uniref:DM domain-containing protein n=1 Tax=Caenorhabditis auriculariae TaxID=2777116 RepID=A0A8S1HW97_9PELO|nr:unnamed protein product [Caenorhabditis auriculariae]
MSEVVATLPQGTQVVVQANLLTSDVDHAIEEVRQEANPTTSSGGVARSNRTLFCRKCEGHGVQVVLKGHASRCPFNNCSCKTCNNVMAMRANAIIRRYRSRTLDGGLVLKPVHFRNGNTRLRVFPKFVDETDALPIPMQNLPSVREIHPSGETIEMTTRNQVVPQTPPANGNGNAPYPVRRSVSEEIESQNQRNDNRQNDAANGNMPLDELKTQFNLLDLLLNPQLAQNGAADLLAQGLLPFTSSNMPVMPPMTNYDAQSLLASLSLPSSSLTYSSPTTYASSFISSPIFTDNNNRKISEPNLACPTAALSELNLGVSTNSPVQTMADIKFNPNTFNGTYSSPPTTTENGNDTENFNEQIDEIEPKIEQPEPFTSSLMIAPGADRSHPLFKQFLNTVRELEKNMLFSS